MRVLLYKKERQKDDMRCEREKGDMSLGFVRAIRFNGCFFIPRRGTLQQTRDVSALRAYSSMDFIFFLYSSVLSFYIASS